jgi:hypothetical protein
MQLTQTPESIKISQIQQKLNDLNQYSDIVLSMIVNLEDKLFPILTSSSPRMVRDKSNDIECVPLAESLSDTVIRLQNAEDILESIFQRLEL